jgi:DNA-binding CsgD family transcriptional regulator
LALELAAEALSRHPALELPDGPPAEVVEELFEVLLNDLSDADRETVEAASILRRITRPLLDAVMADDHAPNAIDDAWRMLRNLPFVSTTSSGLRLHAVAHNAIGGALEIRNPGRVRQVRRKAAAAVLRDTADGPSWDATADLLFLVQNPIIRNSYVPPGDQQHPVERAAGDDLPAILAIAEEYDGPSGAIRLEQWWRAHRDRFVVGRGRDGEVTAFSVVVPRSAVDRDLARTDELLQVVLDDLRRSPIGDGEECLLLRRALGLRRGELPSPELGAMIVDVKRQYLELRRVLARTYAATAHWNILAPLLRSMGFEPFTPETTVGDQSLKPCVLEFGPDHVDGWLLNHILVETTELGAKETTQEIIPASSSSSTPPISRLSAREREVVAVLAEGLTNTEIAERLFISERTANRLLSNIFTKLGVRNRTAAARIAMQAGLTG